MNRINYVAFTLVISGIAFYSCVKEKVDNTKPIINLQEPLNGDILFIGHDVHFDCSFSDDRELKSYKVDIHANFDSHLHKAALNANDEGQPWSFVKTWEFKPGQRNADIHHHEIEIPDSIDNKPVAEGIYHLGVICLDAAGNESKAFIEVVLAHDDEHNETGH